ncbi:MAG: phosphoglucosamine mutase [Dehalococcoidia bacterium]
MRLFGSSGIRRVVDREFLQLTFEVGLAVGSQYPSVVVGHDTRTTSDAMKHAFISGVLSAGATAADAGVAPTPSLSYATRHFAAGAVITASHNPPEYNGIKLVNPDGSAFDSAQRQEIEDLVSGGSVRVASWEMTKPCTQHVSVVEEHLQRILSDFPTELKLKVVVDCGCGAASEVTPVLLANLGCDVVRLNCEPSGHFPRGIEPTPDNLQDLMRVVKSEGAALGIAHDGDADRVAVVDENGRLIGGDQLMVLLARQLGVKRVVTTVDASMAVDELGFEVTRTKVGDAFVSDELRCNPGKNPADEFGGEPSGCFIIPKISLCPDGIYAAAKIAEIASQQRMSSLVEQIPSYPLLRGAIAADTPAMPELEMRLREWVGESGSLESLDGLRASFNDGWVLIRPSGTEPKIRITAEAKSEQRARELYDLAYKTIEECVKGREGAAT